MISFDALKGLPADATLASLKKSAFKDLQRSLAFLAYAPGPIDGCIGKNTRSAWAEFKSHIGEPPDEAVNPSALTTLGAKTTALDGLMSKPAKSADAVRACIIEACKELGLGLKTQIAYVLATAHHETNETFKPVREAYWVKNAEAYRKKHFRYYPYYGRGYVQLTWKDNYKIYSDILGIDLVANPDLALDHYGSVFVLVQGFKTGAFTRRKLADYVNDHATDFVRARYCINGQDRAADIAAIAKTYLAKL